MRIAPISQDFSVRHLFRPQQLVGGGRNRFSAEKPRRLRQSPGLSPRAAFRIRPPNAHYHKEDQSFWIGLLCGGGGRIRTIEAIRSRFTVCPLWPLGNSPLFNLFECLVGAGRRTRQSRYNAVKPSSSTVHRTVVIELFESYIPHSDGAGRRTRTPDLLITNQLLYQLSYTGSSNRTFIL